jgi:hypothetical protein
MEAKISAVDARESIERLTQICRDLPECEIAGDQHHKVTVAGKTMGWHTVDHHGDGRAGSSTRPPETSSMPSMSSTRSGVSSARNHRRWTLAAYMLPTQDDGLFTIDLLRMPSGEEIPSIVDDRYDFRPLSFSADGHFLTMGSDDSGAWVFDVAAVLDGATMEEAVAMNPRGIGAHATYSEMVGDILVFGEDGEVLRFYDQYTRTEFTALPVDTGRGTMLLPAANDRVLYYMDAEGTMRRLPLDVDELVTIAEQRLQRDFTEDECRQYEIAPDCSPFRLEPVGT